jgi:FeS assembly SUF system protein
MALNKLFQQFTHTGRDGNGQSDSAKAVDAEALSSVVDGRAETSNRDESPRLLNPIEKGLLEEAIIETLRECYDPEIPVNIYDMGLIYEINIASDATVDVKMTLTSPACPVAGSLPPEVERRVARVEGVKRAKVEIVWDPIWNMDMMSEDARLELGFY